MQTLAFELRPSMLDEFGLAGALRMLVARHGERTDVRAGDRSTSLPLPTVQVASNVSLDLRLHTAERGQSRESDQLPESYLYASAE